jgi:hypothetical protein
MTIRSALLLAAAALATTAAPALAQDTRYDPGPPPPLPAWDEDRQEYPDEDYVHGEGDWESEGGHHGQPAHAMNHAPDARADWLEQCRATYYDERGRRRGQVIGGLLGAVAGGVAGSAIAEGDDNLAGTLIGAGAGGLAGVAIGGAIGAEADRDRLDECEAYLLRYEQSYRGHGYAAHHGQATYGYHYPYPYPVMWVRVPFMTERRDCGCETVVEERIVEESAPPPPVRRRAPVPDKRVRLVK